MAFSTAQRLMQLAVPTPLAKELGAQLDSGSYNVFRLIEMGMTPGLAKIVVTQPFDGVKAMQLGMTGPVANLIKGGGPLNALTVNGQIITLNNQPITLTKDS